MASVPNKGAWQGDFESSGTEKPEKGAWMASSEPAAVGGGSATPLVNGPIIASKLVKLVF